MSDESQQSGKSDQATEKLPFEPVSTKKKAPKIPATPNAAKSTSKSAKRLPRDQRPGAQIPEIVSQRMARRMTVFSGIPTLLGMMTFVASYFLVKQAGVDLPPSVVLIVSLGFFGLGVVGLSYGLLSASWDEDRMGSLIGTEQFGVNFGRLRAGWKAARQQRKHPSD
jgi:VIT1/CCC1 family predicted Fe2+/Mn2+ transporter